MFQVKHFVLLCIYTLLFTTLFFLMYSIFGEDSSDEADYVEPISYKLQYFDEESGYYSMSGSDISKDEIEKKVQELLLEKLKQEKEQLHKTQIEYHFIPASIQSVAETTYLPLVESFLQFPEISHTIDHLGIYLYGVKGEVRGKMKSQIIHMFSLPEIDPEEFFAVFIHEFGHYHDIHTFQKGSFGDTSQKFYDISWETPSNIKKNLTEKDFVSGYAMTNQYEDFAESYVYYILHNRDFYTRTQTSTLLREKYEYFEKYVFSTKEFFKEDFSPSQETKNYYWDITKIPVDTEKFLQYLQKEI